MEKIIEIKMKKEEEEEEYERKENFVSWRWER